MLAALLAFLFPAPDFPAAFRQRVLLENLDPKLKQIEIVYGSPASGYFKVLEKGGKPQITLTFFPPTYRSPVEFYVRDSKNTLTLKKRLTFRSPLPWYFKKYEPELVEGSIHQPFFLLGGRWEQRLPSWLHYTLPVNGTYFTYLVNRVGEIVWVHFPRPALPTPGRIVKRLADGRYADVQRGVAEARLAIQFYDAQGKVSGGFTEDETAPALWAHHDFTFTKDGNLVIPGRTGMRGPPTGQGGLDFYFGDTLQTVDLASGKVKTVLSLFTLFSPAHDEDWKLSGNALDKRSPKAIPDGPWAAHTDGYDFTHLNSIQRIEGVGYLVSIKKLNKIALIDLGLKKLLWSIGRAKANTYQSLGKAAFTDQHHATLLENGRVLLFDNSVERSRVLELSLDHAHRQATLYREYFPKEKLHSLVFGGAFEGVGNRRIGVFPSHPGKSVRDFYIVEFDGDSATRLGTLKAYGKTDRGLEQVLPLAAIDQETFLGNTP